jgi:Family of unknown function (DUF6069)
MTVTTSLTTEISTAEPQTKSASLWRAGAKAGLVAAAATTAVAVVARALDVPIDADGEAIPILGFAQLTLFFTFVGVLIATGIGRWSRHPRSTFVVTAVVLTVMSCVPDLMLSTDAASKLTLITTHLVAAAIVIPALASRLAEQRVS